MILHNVFTMLVEGQLRNRIQVGIRTRASDENY